MRIYERCIIKKPWAVIGAMLVMILCAHNAFCASPSFTGGDEKQTDNYIGFFLGNTHHSDEDGFSIGVDYEYRLNTLIGVGGIVEYAGGDFDSRVFAAPLSIHPYKGMRLLIAPGLKDEEHNTDFLFRTGVGYQIALSNLWSIMPEYNVDFVEDEEIQVYGLSVGLSF